MVFEKNLLGVKIIKEAKVTKGHWDKKSTEGITITNYRKKNRKISGNSWGLESYACQVVT